MLCNNIPLFTNLDIRSESDLVVSYYVEDTRLHIGIYGIYASNIQLCNLIYDRRKAKCYVVNKSVIQMPGTYAGAFSQGGYSHIFSIENEKILYQFTSNDGGTWSELGPIKEDNNLPLHKNTHEDDASSKIKLISSSERDANGEAVSILNAALDIDPSILNIIGDDKLFRVEYAEGRFWVVKEWLGIKLERSHLDGSQQLPRLITGLYQEKLGYVHDNEFVIDLQNAVFLRDRDQFHYDSGDVFGRKAEMPSYSDNTVECVVDGYDPLLSLAEFREMIEKDLRKTDKGRNALSKRGIEYINKRYNAKINQLHDKYNKEMGSRSHSAIAATGFLAGWSKTLLLRGRVIGAALQIAEYAEMIAVEYNKIVKEQQEKEKAKREQEAEARERREYERARDNADRDAARDERSRTA